MRAGHPVVGVLMPKPVARDAIVAGDTAGAHLIIVVFPLSEAALWIAGARGARCAKGLSEVEQRTLFWCADRLYPIPPTLGAVSNAEIGASVGNVRAKQHGLPTFERMLKQVTC